MSVLLVQGTARQIPLRDGSVHCVVTSPPYHGLRDYGTGQWVGGDVTHTHDRVLARNGRGGSGSPGKQTPDTYPADFAAPACACGAVRVDQQIGLEPLHDCLAWARQEPPCATCWVCSMRAVFKEVKRVLRDDGTLWLNCGSSYVSGIIEPQQYVLREDLSPDEIAYVLRELAQWVQDGYRATAAGPSADNNNGTNKQA